ncbi:TorF family putative porin [Aestuariibacter sp. AA17]|uniref:TorF family putative porin n=1 Tax=Fluctibacter corallii TaxID=2984329 RepID=A0ABT3ACE5_9ALTE|nr:TorF family putative porin [Aestuariibacter sp. AA17]MCV2886358.1 TorF family putative porin [Aestuariibacter sp. AA17]
MTTTKLSAIALLCALSSSAAMANWSTTVTATSDYMFNGVSQTDNNPAIQGSIDYSAESGWYAGTWASNVDFGDETDVEWDVYAGNYWQLTPEIGLDAGIAYYTYHGASYSDELNYPEAYAKFNYASNLGTTEFNMWYSWDYFGLDANHHIFMLAHTFSVAEGHNIRVSADRSTSNNTDRWNWNGRDAYNHVRIAYQTSYNGLDFEVAAEDTNMDIDIADTRVVFTMSKTFSL